MRNGRESSLKKESFKEINNSEDEEILISLIYLGLSIFKLDSLLFFIIYPYKLLELTLYLNFLLAICESAFDNGVK